MRRVGMKRQAAGEGASRRSSTRAARTWKRGMPGASRELRRAGAEATLDSVAEAEAFQPFAAPCHPSRSMEHSGARVFHAIQAEAWNTRAPARPREADHSAHRRAPDRGAARR